MQGPARLLCSRALPSRRHQLPVALLLLLARAAVLVGWSASPGSQGGWVLLLTLSLSLLSPPVERWATRVGRQADFLVPGRRHDDIQHSRASISPYGLAAERLDERVCASTSLYRAQLKRPRRYFKFPSFPVIACCHLASPVAELDWDCCPLKYAWAAPYRILGSRSTSLHQHLPETVASFLGSFFFLPGNLLEEPGTRYVCT